MLYVDYPNFLQFLPGNFLIGTALLLANFEKQC